MSRSLASQLLGRRCASLLLHCPANERPLTNKRRSLPRHSKYHEVGGSARHAAFGPLDSASQCSVGSESQGFSQRSSQDVGHGARLNVGSSSKAQFLCPSMPKFGAGGSEASIRQPPNEASTHAVFKRCVVHTLYPTSMPTTNDVYRRCCCAPYCVRARSCTLCEAAAVSHTTMHQCARAHARYVRLPL
jgi:hypothetical protein